MQEWALALSEQADIEHSVAVSKRIPAWIQNLSEDWVRSKHGTWAWARLHQHPRIQTVAMQDHAKEWTLEPHRQLFMVQEYWQGIMCPGGNVPTLASFVSEYAHFIPKGDWKGGVAIADT